MSGFDYGNARLRAMWSRLFDRPSYQELIATGSLDGLIGALAHTTYEQDVTASLARFSGQRRIDEAIRSHLERTISAVRSFYERDIRNRIDLMLLSWDLHNLVTILRGQARMAPVDEITPLLVAAGSLEPDRLVELARQTSVRATLDLLGVWRSPSITRLLPVVRARYESTGDPAILEDALVAGLAAHQLKMLSAWPEDQVLADAVRASIDVRNLAVALRLRAIRSLGIDIGMTDLDRPSARIGAVALEEIVRAETPQQVLELLEHTGITPGWLDAVTSWTEHTDVARLVADLERIEFWKAVAGFRSGDPLGIAVPFGFMAAAGMEARNLRMIARSLVHRLPPDDIDDLLVVAA